MTEKAPFELSRIYAKGWSAGGSSTIEESDDGVEAAIAALNPYQDGAERERWALGFQDALRRSQKMAGRARAPRKSSVRAQCAPTGE